MKVLHAAAECFPFVKTGGLGDVLGALPQAIARLGADVRLVLPGLPPLMSALSEATVVATLRSALAFGEVRVRRGTLRSTPGERGMPAYLIDAPALFARGGGPYQDTGGRDWPDNFERFALLSTLAARLASGEIDRSWRADVLHAHDWHTGLACAALRQSAPHTPRSVFTIHNLGYAGLFALDRFDRLGLDPTLAHPGAALEFHGQLSLLKAGLVCAHRVTTVSPTYAHEITTADHGNGFDGVIRAREEAVIGILNGIDTSVWDPQNDAALATTFTIDNLDGKRQCKRSLLEDFGLPADDERPLLGIVSRFSHQKGLDLVVRAWPMLQRSGARLVVLGSGDGALESAFQHLAASYPNDVGVVIGYDERRAHRIIAGADALLVPSRFEPCGLTQLYALRYGTLPIVRRVGGLTDTVDPAVGFSFGPSDDGFEDAVMAMLDARSKPHHWSTMQRAAMSRDHDWASAARAYLALYRSL